VKPDRAQIAVASNEEGVDPIGSCVGQKGTRVQAVIDELGGEKIDIIEWNDDVAKFISNALSPAKVLGVKIIESKKEARVAVPADQLSLTIGKQGQNVRLAAKLTGWKIDVVSGEPSSAVATEGKEKKEKEEEKEKGEKEEEKSEKIKEEKKDAEEVAKEDKLPKKKKKATKKKPAAAKATADEEKKPEKESKLEKKEEPENKTTEEKKVKSDLEENKEEEK
jgi:N utilization substance protein A